LERFVAILLEHTGGNFPLWLAPTQVNLLSVSEKHEKYAQKVLNFLENNEIRGSLDNRNETIGKKIREAELSKVPFMLILGEKEAELNNVSVRKHRKGDVGAMSLESFAELIEKEVSESISKFEN
jgi:threonyl-tRNA synthetase